MFTLLLPVLQNIIVKRMVKVWRVTVKVRINVGLGTGTVKQVSFISLNRFSQVANTNPSLVEACQKRKQLKYEWM